MRDDTFRPVVRTDGYAPIGDYAVIGDGRTAALVAGFMLGNYGRATAAVTVVAHLAYCAIVGAFAAGL